MTTTDYTLAESRQLRDEVKRKYGRDFYSHKLLGVKPGMALNDLCARMEEDLEDAPELNEFDSPEDFQ